MVTVHDKDMPPSKFSGPPTSLRYVTVQKYLDIRYDPGPPTSFGPLTKPAARKENMNNHIWTIWSNDGAALCLLDSWDSFTAEEDNPAGWAEAIQKAKDDFGPDAIRVIKINVPDMWDKVQGIFNSPPSMDGEIAVPEPGDNQ